MKRSGFVLGLMMVLFFSTTFFARAGGSLSVYLYGNPFNGPAILQPHDVYLEESALIRALNISPDLLETAQTMSHGGETYVSLSDVATILHSQIDINAETGIVDLYPGPGAYQGESGPTAYAIPSSEGATVVIPPSAYQTQWQNCSPVSCLPNNPLPPPAVNIAPVVGNPWYGSYPPYAPDPYYGSSNPDLYNYGGYPYPYYGGYGGFGGPMSISRPARIEGGVLPVNSQGIPMTQYMGPGFDFHP